MSFKDNNRDKRKISITTITNTNTEYVAFSTNNEYLVKGIKQAIDSEDLNDDAVPLDAVFNFLVKLHKQETSSKYLENITVIYNPDIYPCDTIKFNWYGETIGGMVVAVQHNIQPLPDGTVTGRTNITYTSYSLADLQDIIKYKARAVPING